MDHRKNQRQWIIVKTKMDQYEVKNYLSQLSIN